MKNSTSNLNRLSFKYTIVSTFVFGLIAHGFCFLNSNFSHDCLNQLNYSDDKIYSYIQLGRYLRPVYELFKARWTLPWLNGLLSLFFLAISIYFINLVIGLNKKSEIIISCAILSTCSSYTLLNASYLHDTDSYCLALLLASLGIWVSKSFKKGSIVGTLLYVLSLSIYQAYMQVVLFIGLIIFVSNLLNNKSTVESIKELATNIASVIIAMLLYYSLYKVLLFAFGLAEANGYNSISQATNIGLRGIFSSIKSTYEEVLNWFIYPNTNSILIIRLANTVLLMSLVIMTIEIIIIKRINYTKTVLIFIALIASPFLMNIMSFISGQSHALTMYSINYSYILVLVISKIRRNINTERKRKPAIWIALIALCVVVFESCLYSNKIYLQKDLINKNTLSTMTRIIDRMEQTEGYIAGETPVALIGYLNNSSLNFNRENSINEQSATGVFGSFATTYDTSYRHYFNNYLGYPVNLISEKEFDEINANKEVADMEPFPARTSCKMIEGIMVVKLSN